MSPAKAGVYFEIRGVASVKWDEKISTVVTEWEGWANPTEFALLLDAEIHALSDHHASRQLADCRHQKGLKLTDQEKAAHEWLPRALTLGLKKFAVVRPTSGLAAANLEERLAKAPPSGVEVRYFATVEEARLWLAT